MELLLTGEPVDGRRAGELGLANRVTAKGQAVAEALRLAEQVATNAPLALAVVKRVVRAADGTPDAEAFAFQRGEMKTLMASDDVREGMTAFAERRPARWTGR